MTTFGHIPVRGEPLVARMEYAERMGTVFPINETSFAFVSAQETVDEQPLVGNVVRTVCPAVGNRACKEACQLAALQGRASEELVTPDTPALLEALERDPMTLLDEDPTVCADNNLLRALSHLGIRPQHALMVSVPGENIGFLDDEVARAQLKRNPHGWFEIVGYNAFFTYEDELLPGPDGQPDSERALEVFGARLADSGWAVVSAKKGDRKIAGWVHITRTNMLGRSHRKVYNGRQQGYFEHALRELIDHFEIESPDDITIRMVAAVGAESWQKRYASRRDLEQNLPGWPEEGLIRNVTNPDWQPGQEVFDPVTEERDLLHPDYPAKVRMEIMDAAEALGITGVFLDDPEPLDPGQVRDEKVHASENRKRLPEPSRHEPGVRDFYALVLN